MLGFLFEAVDVDPRQWGAMVRVALKLDLRRGPKLGTSRDSESGLRNLVFLLIMQFATSIILLTLVLRNQNTMLTSLLVLGFLMLMVVSSLLIDYNTIVVSPDDYWILSHRPISSRTFFLAKVTGVVVYVALMTTALTIVPAIGFGFVGGFRPLVAVGAMVGFYTSTLFCALLVVGVFAAVMTLVRPTRLRNALSYLQLFTSLVFYGGYVFLPQFFDTFESQMSLATDPWLLLVPLSWFAAFIQLASGDYSWPVWLGVSLSMASCFGLGFLAARRLSTGYMRALAEAQAAGAGTAAGKREGKITSTRLFKSHEGRAIAVLLWNQFRFDQKFRLAVLGILPLTVFYLFMAVSEGIQDPFRGLDAAMKSGNVLYVAVLLFPLMLKPSLTYSEWHEASWVFHTTPVRRERLLASLKNAVVIYFLAPYLLIVAGVFWWFYESAWHAAFAVGLAGLLAYVLLQLSILTSPDLPFSKPHGRSQRSARLLVVFMIGPAVGYTTPIAIGAVAQSPILLAGLVVLPASLAVALEFLVKWRIRRMA